MSSTASDHLVLDRLTASYGGLLAVHDVTLEVRRGELVSLLGPSGCGKTTTLRMVAGFVTPTAGRVLVDGIDLSRSPTHRRNVGVVFQSFALFPHLTVLENVAFGLRMRHQPRAQRTERAVAALAMVGLGQHSDRYPSQLSGGQQQRVALARAVVIEPRVLLLDEPLSSLDAGLRAEMRGEIRELQQRLRITTLFVTHDQAEALAMSDRVAVMSAARLVEIGSPRQLCERPADPFTARFLGARTVVDGVTREGVFTAPGISCGGAPEGATRLVLRAARLRVGYAEADGALHLEGRLASSIYLGDFYEVVVDAAAGPIRVLTPAEQPPPAVGTSCRVSALSGAASFIR